jgi:hypothetical protein
MNNEEEGDLEGSGHSLVETNYPGICVQGLRKTIKTIVMYGNPCHR